MLHTLDIAQLHSFREIKEKNQFNWRNEQTIHIMRMCSVNKVLDDNDK